MKKRLKTLGILVIFFLLNLVSVSAAESGTVAVGLRYASSAMASANLENTQGSGFQLGYYNGDHAFSPLGQTGHAAVTMVPATSLGGSCAQSGPYGSFDEAASAAAAQGGWPAYVNGGFYARWNGGGASHSATGVAVTASGSGAILFEFDCQGVYDLGVVPLGGGPVWFRGYRYAGGFSYPRVTGGNLYVVNMVSLEDYVKGVIPYEMGRDWPAAALQAQAVCARTYAAQSRKHLSAYGFDLCNTTDCQVYNGVGSESSYATPATDAAVDATAGQCVYYQGEIAETVYHAADGGATESAENVWGSQVGYLLGKADPYESAISIPNYSYTVTYTPAELTWVLQNSGYSIGQIKNAYVAERTATGNVYKVTFVDTTGKTLTVKGETCRMAFYSTTYSKNVRSMRFSINGDDGAAYYVSGGGARTSLSGAYTISGSGVVAPWNGGEAYVITSSSTAALKAPNATASANASPGSFVITGTGNGHNVGLSQYGARAMAEQGHTYLDILNFYYTNINVG